MPNTNCAPKFLLSFFLGSSGKAPKSRSSSSAKFWASKIKWWRQSNKNEKKPLPSCWWLHSATKNLKWFARSSQTTKPPKSTKGCFKTLSKNLTKMRKEWQWLKRRNKSTFFEAMPGTWKRSTKNWSSCRKTRWEATSIKSFLKKGKRRNTQKGSSWGRKSSAKQGERLASPSKSGPGRKGSIPWRQVEELARRYKEMAGEARSGTKISGEGDQGILRKVQSRIS